ncbi:hypothetical protein F0562_028259 [Nyssa sinensis]|uniref:Uncharacterized protein n=1 Tax=Nyssa sinensis TaxID=561372 RepID=A0A5J5BBQ1_9ASTE|nr:hypothetical protein F0562_028259 [Nyssa sinensis]
MLKQTVHHVSTRIDARLRHLPSETSNPCIFRVHARLRKENEKAYEPEILAIGHYHHGSKLPGPKPLSVSPEKVEHLLHLMHFSWCSSFTGRKVSFTIKESKLEFIKSTIELLEFGIKFTDARESTSVLDIKFENGVMKIPTLVVDDNTECFLRNLIAYEQYQRTEPRYVTDYMTLMDCLISSAKDVEILRHKGISNNCLGDDEAICTMFNSLGNNVHVLSWWFCYTQVFHNVNEHCRRGWNKQLGQLRHDYFNSPWSTISFLAAAALLLLTLAQTIFSALSYWK